MRKQGRQSKLMLSMTKIRELQMMEPTDLQRVAGGLIGPCAQSIGKYTSGCFNGG
jgi:hypothetical protein